MSGGAGPPKNTVNIVRRVTVDEATLKKIAALLGIPDSDIAQGVSGVIYVGTATTPPTPVPPTGRRRPRK